MSRDDSVTSQQRERFIDALARHLATVLEGVNVDSGKIDIAVSDVVSLVAEDFAGQHFYIPTNYTHESMARAMAIYEACNGRNHSEVAKQFGCSDRTVYRIYKRMRKLMTARNQADMFTSH